MAVKQNDMAVSLDRLGLSKPLGRALIVGLVLLTFMLGASAAGAAPLERILHRGVTYHPSSGLRLLVEGQDRYGEYVVEERWIPVSRCVASAYFYFGPLPDLYKTVLVYRHNDGWYVIGDVLFTVKRFKTGEELSFITYLDVPWDYDFARREIRIEVNPDVCDRVPDEFVVPLTSETVREKILFEEVNAALP